MSNIAIFGGTFDPVHNGHIQTSLFIQSTFNFDSYIFLPCKIPTIKPPSTASSQQRIEMLKLALKNHPEFNLDLREINRDSPSYMVETLSSFKSENKNANLTLILGYDAFLSLPQWHQWEKIIKLANLLVINRAQYVHFPISEAIKKLLLNHKTEIKTDLLTNESGCIYLFDAGNYDISSTNIREELKAHNQINAKIPMEVYEYIKQLGLYQ